MTKKIDNKQACKDNPDLPPAFVEEVALATKEMARGDYVEYVRGLDLPGIAQKPQKYDSFLSIYTKQ